MRKPVIIITILLLSFNSSFSQDQQKAKSFILYSNFDFSSKYLNQGEGLQNGTTRMIYEKEYNGFNLSPALVVYNNKGNSHAIEISRLKFENDYNKEYYMVDSTGEISSVISGENLKHFECYIRYEYAIGLFKKRNWEKLNASIGFSATPFLHWQKSNPLLSSEFPFSRIITGLYLSVIPRVEYNINQKWFIDLNIPVALATASFTSTKIDNPAIPLNERTYSTIDFYNGPISFAIRLGIGFVFPFE